jgi:hypothetical protein
MTFTRGEKAGFTTWTWFVQETPADTVADAWIFAAFALCYWPRRGRIYA